jgi:hypothetical protein
LGSVTGVSKTVVEDDESLYRCIFFETSDNQKVYQIKGKKALVSANAFRDSGAAPSVDRACLCNFDPTHTQKNPKDGVIRLICRDVRLIDTVTQNDPKGNPTFTYKIDVLHRPLPDNVAHAQIEPSPSYQSKGGFRKLMERLAFLANQQGWEILPWEIRQNQD